MPSKYGAVRTEADGIEFASKVEAKRYNDLRVMEMAGLIKDLACHPRFELLPAKEDCYGNRHRAVHYTGDFAYLEGQRRVIEDVKGYVQADAKLRMAMLMHQHPELDVRIVQWDRKAGWVVTGVAPKAAKA